MTIKEAERRIKELEEEVAALKAELAKYDGKKPAGRRTHNEAWTAHYEKCVTLLEQGYTIAEIMNMTGFSRRTCYRYKEYYEKHKNMSETENRG